METAAVPGSAARGLGPGPAVALRRQVSKTRTPGSPSTFLNFLFGPLPPERPWGAGARSSLSPGQSVGARRGGTPECEGPGPEQLPAA